MEPDPEDATRRWPARALPVALVGLAWGIAMLLPLTSGAFWPISVAPDVIAERATTFSHDELSPLAVEGGGWVLQPWVPALLMHATFELVDVPGLVVLQGLLAAFAAWLLWRLARALAAPVPAAIASLAGVVLLLPTTLRPEQFAIALAALLLLVVRTRSYWWAPVLLALWVNVHGSVPIGIAIVIAALLAMVRSPDGGAPPVATAPWPRRLAWCAACLAAPFASPLGVGIVDYVRSVQGLPELRAVTPVWRALDPASPHGVLLIVIVVALVLASIPTIRRVTASPARAYVELAPVIPVLVLAMATIGTVRYASWFAILAVPELARALMLGFRRLEWAATTRSPIIAGALLAPVVVLAAVLLPGTPWQDENARRGLPPADLLRDIDDDDLVLASIEWANYVHVRTGAQVVLDARLERYRSRDLQAYVAFLSGDDELVRRTRPDVMLLHDVTAADVWDRPLEPAKRYFRAGEADNGRRYDRSR